MTENQAKALHEKKNTLASLLDGEGSVLARGNVRTDGATGWRQRDQQACLIFEPFPGQGIENLPEVSKQIELNELGRHTIHKAYWCEHQRLFPHVHLLIDGSPSDHTKAPE